MKTKKIEKRAKKIKPGNEDEKALSKKKGPGKVLGAAAEKDSDITERKKAESQREAALEAMVKSENRFRSIFESSRDAIMTLEPPYWKFTSGNPAALKMFMAKDEADFASHEPWTMSPERQPDGRASTEKAKEMIETAMRDGSNFFEWTHKRLNGEEFPATVLLTRMILAEKMILQATVRDITERKRVESQREAALEALQKAHDELDSQVQERTAELAQANEMLQADISERKQAEEAFLREKAFLDQLVESAPEAIVLVENNGQILRVNSEFEKMFGYSAKEAVGRLIDDLVVPPKYRREATDVTQTVVQGEKFSLETVRRRKDGALLHVSLVGSPIIIGGEQVATYGIYRDISERKQAEEALQTAFQENRNLLGELQHRAKNSFAMIFGMISLALNAGVSPETKIALDDLGSRVRSVSELYSLLYSAGSFTEVRLDEYCARIAAPLVGLSGNITLNTEMESITVPVKEAAPIGLILTELMTNAGKYAFPGGRRGTITVALKKTAAGAFLEVRDDGIGLPAGFDFSGSAGMGLNLVRALSGQINGSFRMEGGAAGTRCIVEFAAANNGSK